MCRGKRKKRNRKLKERAQQEEKDAARQQPEQDGKQQAQTPAAAAPAASPTSPAKPPESDTKTPRPKIEYTKSILADMPETSVQSIRLPIMDKPRPIKSTRYFEWKNRKLLLNNQMDKIKKVLRLSKAKKSKTKSSASSAGTQNSKSPKASPRAPTVVVVSPLASNIKTKTQNKVESTTTSTSTNSSQSTLPMVTSTKKPPSPATASPLNAQSTLGGKSPASKQQKQQSAYGPSSIRSSSVVEMGILQPEAPTATTTQTKTNKPATPKQTALEDKAKKVKDGNKNDKDKAAHAPTSKGK